MGGIAEILASGRFPAVRFGMMEHNRKNREKKAEDISPKDIPALMAEQEADNRKRDEEFRQSVRKGARQSAVKKYKEMIDPNMTGEQYERLLKRP